ncbi:MAG TPA: helix-hairpin-helix domain-containing protein [Bacteroidia bacterium]
MSVIETRNRTSSLKELMEIPGVGKSIANDLYNIHITSIADLKNQSPEELYHLSNQYAGVVQDRCLLYVFRCAVYYASEKVHQLEKLKWWNWKDTAQ